MIVNLLFTLGILFAVFIIAGVVTEAEKARIERKREEREKQWALEKKLEATREHEARSFGAGFKMGHDAFIALPGGYRPFLEKVCAHMNSPHIWVCFDKKSFQSGIWEGVKVGEIKIKPSRQEAEIREAVRCLFA